MGVTSSLSHSQHEIYCFASLGCWCWARPQPADEDDWSFNAIFDYIPDGDEVYDTIVESVPKPVVTVAKSFFVADEDKDDKGRDGVDKESLINQTKPHIKELSKLGRETYKELSHIFDDLVELANLDKVSEEDAANEQKQIVNLSPPPPPPPPPPRRGGEGSR